MSSVMTAAIAAEIDLLQAKHDAAFKTDVASLKVRLKADLESQFGRVTALAAKVAAKPAVATVKTVPVVVPKTTKPKVRKAKGAPKYHDPANPQNKPWTGRGTKPGWFKAGIASGKTPDYFAIPGA